MSKVKEIIRKIKDWFKPKSKEKKPGENEDSSSHLTWNLPDEGKLIEPQVVPTIVNKKAKKTPRFHINKRKLIMTCIPILGVVAGLITAVVYATQDHDFKKTVEIESDTVYHRVYLISNNNLVVPVSVKYEKKNTFQEQVFDVFDSLKVDSSLTPKGLRGYIPSKTQLKEIQLTNGALTLNMSEDFLTMTETSEVQVLESLVHSFLELEGVNNLTLKVNGTLLTNLPTNKTPVSQQIDTSFGINKPFVSAIEATQKERVVIYYNTTINSQSYMVPVSLYVDEGKERVSAILESISIVPDIQLNLSSISTYSQIDTSVTPMNTDDYVIFGLHKNALINEGVVNESIYELMSLSLSMNGINKPVSFQIEGETVRVNGYLETNSVAVSSIIYNEIQI